MSRKVLIHIIATSRYEKYVKGLIDSAEKHFLKEEDVSFILYTDSNFFLENQVSNVRCIQIQHEPWPAPTLKRFHYFSLSLDLIRSSDLSFYIDVDSLFIKDISAETLGIGEGFKGIIATLHPGFYGTRGTPERRVESLAAIPFGVNNLYFCGGFFGGSGVAFAELVTHLQVNIQNDLERGIIAVWHDESHLNRYMVDFPPSSILGFGFACPEERKLKEPVFMDPYIIFLDKDVDLKLEKGQNVY